MISLLLLAAVSCDRVRPALKHAECERKAGHSLKALEVIEEHLAKKPKDKKALKLREALRAEIVTFEWFSEPEGALVSVDGEDPAGATPITVTVDAGKHTFHFTHDGYVPMEREETAISGTRPKLTAVLEREPSLSPVGERAGVTGEERAEKVLVPKPVEELQAPPIAAAPLPAPREHSNAPLILGSAGLFVAIGGGVLILTSLLARPFDIPAQNRQYAGYAMAGAGAAAGLAAIIWLLIDRKPGAATGIR